MLILSIIIVFIMDVLNTVIKIGYRMAAAYVNRDFGELSRPSPYMKEIYREAVESRLFLTLPRFLVPFSVRSTIFVFWLIAGIGLLAYGIYQYSFWEGIIYRLIPWILGKIAGFGIYRYLSGSSPKMY